MVLMKIQTKKQIERQKYREQGKYAKVNPCFVCKKSAGENYFSHPDTDKTIKDQLLRLCKKCYIKYKNMPGTEAVKAAFQQKDLYI